MLLITSTREGFCLPLLEAGAFKLPVACADVPPLPEVVEKDAVLFGLEEDPKVIAERIARFLESNKSARLFKRVLGNYCWESVYEKHLKPLLE
jgi:glycosyltransferase involved in cell wall biosynthesis